MGMTAAVVGASGYAGGELLRLLAAHPDLDVGAVAAASNAGRPLSQLHPQLRSLSDLVLCGPDDPAIAAADVVFLALPHGESARVAAALPDSALVVDLGADFRLSRRRGLDPVLRRTSRRHLALWAAGASRPARGDRRARRDRQPRLLRDRDHARVRAAAGGRIVEPTDLVVTAASGTSGAGRTPKPHLLGTEVMGDLSTYKVGGTHQHLAEIRQSLAAAAEDEVTMSFTPVLAPMPRGILATCSARINAGTRHRRAAVGAARGVRRRTVCARARR